jgi:Hemerythrin HHE cation binding domain
LKTPESLKEEHEELHRELEMATRVPGRVGKAAKGVAKILHPHFVKEEEYALPPLALLSRLAEGAAEAGPEMGDAIEMTDRLNADLPHMLKEHEGIVAALANLSTAAKESRKPKYAHFAKKLTLHARNEEEILYPAAILVGKYLKLRFHESEIEKKASRK